MTIQLNDTQITIPRSKEEFTLGQRIDFHNKYGRELQKLFETLNEIESDEERSFYETHYEFECAFRTVAYFLNTTPEAIKKSDYIDEAFKIYHSALAPLFVQNPAPKLQRAFTWQDKEWVLQEPELEYGSMMKFGELIDAKQATKNVLDNGGSEHELILSIAAIYLRQKGEEYDESFLYTNSSRLTLMRELPMSIAEQVGFFLSCTINTSMIISKCFGNRERNQAASLSSSILTTTGG